MNTSSTIVVFGNRRCRRCSARSKRSGQQCRAPAVVGSGKTTGRGVCRMHGSGSSGAKTPEGRQRCSQANLIHGRETRAIRKARSEKLAELRLIEQQMYKLGMLKNKRGMTGTD